MSASAPRTPQAHLIESALGRHLFVADGSRLFDAEEDLFRRCGEAMARGDGDEIDGLLEQGDSAGRPSSTTSRCRRRRFARCRWRSPRSAISAAPIATRSRANSGARRRICRSPTRWRRGSAGRRSGAGERLNLAFLGGEPLVNRPTLQAAARRARELAEARGATVNYSITTNGTLLTEDDARFLGSASPSPLASTVPGDARRAEAL